eukprot:TRINITY_DN2543_c0_g1_i2.p1 TRINITY_DN2543_c0_g1~~TRINITY_DN2543_c0_g1_i2.p1  ORF type:complete len:365 (+),score=22.09 TRINITY_DN2543_c0_g1_i2:62-1156(+)
MILHCDCPSLRARVKEEWSVLKQIWWQLVIFLIIVMYFSSMVFRSMAFYRYKGLDYYSDMVMPSIVTLPLNSTNLVLVDTVTGQTSPLQPALKSSFHAAKWNISASNLHLKSNLSALGGAAFNLVDIAHEYLPDNSQNAFIKTANEIMAQIILDFAYLLCVVPLFLSFQGHRRPHGIAMFQRLLRSTVFTHLLRPLTYLVTALPGAAPHCQSTRWTSTRGEHGTYEVNRGHSQTVGQWFFDSWNLTNNSNCGDLLFSGHTVTMMTNACMVHYYANVMFPDCVCFAVRTVMWFLAVLQLFCILTTHNHYSADVMIGLYVGPLMWISTLYVWPEDVKPLTECAEGNEADGQFQEIQMDSLESGVRR